MSVTVIPLYCRGARLVTAPENQGRKTTIPANIETKKKTMTKFQDQHLLIGKVVRWAILWLLCLHPARLCGSWGFSQIFRHIPLDYYQLRTASLVSLSICLSEPTNNLSILVSRRQKLTMIMLAVLWFDNFVTLLTTSPGKLWKHKQNMWKGSSEKNVCQSRSSSANYFLYVSPQRNSQFPLKMSPSRPWDPALWSLRFGAHWLEKTKQLWKGAESYSIVVLCTLYFTGG